MAKQKKTTGKLPAKPFTGVEGNTFSKDNQPDPALKKAGWEEWRKQRNLTKSVIEAMVGKDGRPKKAFKEYITSLIDNAKGGNPKAIDAVNKCLEDDIIKVAQTDTAGNDVLHITKVEIVRPLTDGE